MKKLKIPKSLINILRGAGSILEIMPSQSSSGMKKIQAFREYGQTPSPEQQNARAIQLDWEHVGRDLNYAIRKPYQTKRN